VATSEDFVQTALTRKGDAYVFGSEASPLDPDPKTLDCSELVQWAGARVGVTIPDGSFNQWPFTRHIPVDQGLHTRGALLFVGTTSRVHHVAISLGDSTTIEARGKAWGVGTWAAVGRFDGAGLIPGLTYVAASPPPPVNRGGGIGIQPGASSKQAVSFLQNMLNIIRAHNQRSLIAVDGAYGNQTKAAVAEFQREFNSTFHGRLLITGGADPATCDAIAVCVKLVLGAK
jgi:cell wall-associated NlpC family hydrolase